MYYDYDDYWAELSEFDQQIEEFKDSLRNSVKDEIFKDLDNLKNEDKPKDKVFNTVLSITKSFLVNLTDFIFLK